MEENNFEYIDLPSNGLCYHKDSPLRSGRIALRYLTANDENVLFSQMFKNDKTLLKTVISDKIVDENINVNELCKGDLEAVMVWLRKTGYGNEITVDVTNHETNDTFTTDINLSDLSNNDFNEIDDGDGNFMYFMKNGDKINFRYVGYYDLIEMYDKITEESTEQEQILNNLLVLFISSINGETSDCFIENYIMEQDFNEKVMFWLYINDTAPSINKIIKDEQQTMILEIDSNFLIM